MTLQSMDILIHNLLAVVPAIVVLLLLTQLVAATVLRISNRLMRSAVLAEVTHADRDMLRRRVRRQALYATGLGVLLLVAGAFVASFLRVRALDVIKAAFARREAGDLVALQTHLAVSAGILVGALVLDVTTRGLVAALGRGLSRSPRFETRKELFLDTVSRVRVALRAAIVGTAAVLVVETLELSPATQRAVAFAAYVLAGLYLSRAVSRCAHIVIDVLFGVSGKLSALDGPLKHLGSLGHLSGVAKTATDYFIYVGATTWVADKLTPETWVARAGLIGLRAIAIFFLSRIVVEICVLFINEIFLAKGDDKRGDLQRRMTLVPVAVGLVRYGIYFSCPGDGPQGGGDRPDAAARGRRGDRGGDRPRRAGVRGGHRGRLLHPLREPPARRRSRRGGQGARRGGEIGVRITKIREESGVLHALPNGEVRKVANHSKIYVNAMVDVYVPYETEMKHVESVLRAVTEEVVLAETGVAGAVEVKVQELTEGSIHLRVIARLPPGKDEEVGDVLKGRVVEALRAAGIGAPRHRRAVLIDQGLRVGGRGAAPEEEESGPPKPFEAPKAAEG